MNNGYAMQSISIISVIGYIGIIPITLIAPITPINPSTLSAKIYSPPFTKGDLGGMSI